MWARTVTYDGGENDLLLRFAMGDYQSLSNFNNRDNCYAYNRTTIKEVQNFQNQLHNETGATFGELAILLSHLTIISEIPHFFLRNTVNPQVELRRPEK